MTEPAQDTKPKIKGEPLDLEDLMALAPIEPEDIASALVFFDGVVPDDAKGTLG